MRVLVCEVFVHGGRDWDRPLIGIILINGRNDKGHYIEG